MEWALGDRPGVEDFAEYEARLNGVLPNFDDVVVCVYDLTKFPASTIIDVMRAHPAVVLGGSLRANPFYTPPDQMVDELHRRSAGETA